jgi:hypothetical protein
MAKVRTSAGVSKGSSGAKSVNPLYAAARGVARYVGGAAREIRDIPTAVGTGDTQEIKMQIKEAGAALTAGQKGKPVFHTMASGKIAPSARRRGTK